jgi:hypothetical protein
MTYLRTPDIVLLACLGPILLAFWGSWQAFPDHHRTPGQVLTLAFFLSAPALFVALGTVITRVRTRNAPLRWDLFIVLLGLLLVSILWVCGMFMTMG